MLKYLTHQATRLYIDLQKKFQKKGTFLKEVETLTVQNLFNSIF